MSKVREGLYGETKASGGMYSYVPPMFFDISSLLEALLECLDRPKSANYKIEREVVVVGH